jgi:hypothetical protein
VCVREIAIEAIEQVTFGLYSLYKKRERGPSFQFNFYIIGTRN